MLTIFDSMTKTKRAFQPIRPGKISLYVCGMTVYDYCHIGHGRMMVTFDVIVRVMRQLGYEVTYVRNITDIDDKIIRRAQEKGETATDLAQRFIDVMHEDELALGVNLPDMEPRATAYIPQMIQFIEALCAKGAAYQAASGDVCYRVEFFSEYGKLSKRSVADLRAGVRKAADDTKDNPLDFVLWKLAKPGEPSWPSPWGDGRPGWHIECSTMSSDLLGQPFDIHGGGIDLKFPHHDNEIAQSEVANECCFANTWMHVGHVQVNDEKMSKSLGNFLTLRDALAQFHPEVLRYFMVAGHYRSPINFSKENMKNASAALARLYTAIRGLDLMGAVEDSAYTAAFYAALSDDFNTPKAFAVLFEMAKDINRLRNQGVLEAATCIAIALKQLCGVLGLLNETPDVFLQADVNAADINALIDARNKARAVKDWARSDAIRDELLEKNIVIEDGPNGTTWKSQ